MKRIFGILAVAACMLAVSCKKEQPYVLTNATATVKTIVGGGFYFEIDPDLAAVASNLKTFPLEPDQKEARVTMVYAENGSTVEQIPGYKVTKAVDVYRYEVTLTKEPLAYDPGITYVNDPVGLYLPDAFVFPTTMIEDGYLSISFVYPVGLGGHHEVNLLSGVDPEDPYTVKFIHNANGDMGMGTQTGLVCFPLKSLPDTKGKTVKLTVKWNSMKTGKEESVQFDYCSRQDW